MRVKGGPASRRKHKKIFKANKGYRMSRKSLWHPSNEAYLHAGEYAFAGRRLRRRDLRSLWITRISAGLLAFDLCYSKFIALLEKANIEIDRKILAELAVSNIPAFKAIVEKTLK